MDERGTEEKLVGIIGLGIMGGAISTNLVQRGWSVIGYDIDEARRHEAAEAGVTVVESASQVAAHSRTIMTSLPTPAAAQIVAQTIAHGSSPHTVVELSTFALDDKLAFKSILDASNHVALDCPLSGTGAQAKMRDLVVYASGDSTAIKRCELLFADFAKQSVDLGAYGNGSRMKFVANLLVAIHNVAAAEAMMVAESAGLDLRQVIECVGAGAGGSRMFQMRAPMMAKGTYAPATMRVATWKKDMAIIDRFVNELGCAVPLFAATVPFYEKALAMGFADQDTASVFEVFKSPSSTGVRP
ncbi:NAD(P)-dependent oxidoreductase [Bradyrhizobium sp. CNPSo 4026]|nr:NAD(P)-dependent oxidoreductase [Bradyrhizobium cenepequi]